MSFSRDRLLIVKLFNHLPPVSTILASELPSTSNHILVRFGCFASGVMRGDSASVASDMVAARANGMHCPIPALKAATTFPVISDWFGSHIGLPKHTISMSESIITKTVVTHM
ncbi:hypothetical protein QL093DRAFT_2263729 [Fusarium oxysporum]|nr:hypothetical protein QL093DRAFT_2263729 [Fusarium oxysporum]